MLYDLLFVLIIFLYIIILLSILFYDRLRIRDYYFSNTATGDAVTFTQTGDYYTFEPQAGADLTFIPLQKDKKRKISGSLVLLTNADSTGYYRIRVMNGTEQLSEGIYRIDQGLGYNSVNFTAPANDSRNLVIRIQKFDKNTNLGVAGQPTGIRLVKAWSYYYYY